MWEGLLRTELAAIPCSYEATVWKSEFWLLLLLHSFILFLQNNLSVVLSVVGNATAVYHPFFFFALKSVLYQYFPK